METEISFPFSDFPEDVQLCVLSFLRPSDLAKFSVTCKRFVSLWHDRRLWYTMCHHRWGSETVISKWGGGHISYKRLYLILDEHEKLIGFWRQYGETTALHAALPLVFFEWGPFYIMGSRIFPAKNGGYDVIKKPFLWMSVSGNEEVLNYLDPDGRFAPTEEVMIGELGFVQNQLIRVNMSFMGERHVMVEENSGFPSFIMDSSLASQEMENVYGSSPEKMMMEIYQSFANRISPSGNGVMKTRRQRRREKERQGRMRKWGPDLYAKIVNCSPESNQPLQGLWKGIGDDLSLDFYLVSYEGLGVISCQKIGNSNAPVFLMSNLAFFEPPFSCTEDYIYNCRTHVRPHLENDQENVEVSRIFYIKSSYELVIPGLVGPTVNSRQAEGRMWQYENGSFGFGFLGDNYIIDLRRVARNGHLVDAIEADEDLL